MRICYFADGRSIHTQRWVEYFAGQGHEIHLMSYEPYTGQNGSIVHHDLQPLNSLHLAFGWLPKVRAIEHLLRARRVVQIAVNNLHPDLVHGHFLAGYGHLAFLSGWHPLVVTAWGSDIYLYRSQSVLSRLLTKLTLRRADLITCDSLDLRQSLVKLGAHARKIHVIHFGVDTTLFNPHCDVTALRRELGLAEEEQVVLSPRHIRSHYNIDTIVHSFAILQTDFPKLKLLLKDYFGDESYRASIEALIRELNLEHRVTFLGQVPYKEMVKLYNVADVVVSLATTDSAPISVLEAMACGNIVVASDLPSLREWIEEGVNGYLVNPHDPEEVAAKLRCALMLDPKTKQEWAQRNRAIIQARGDQRQHMTKMETLYQGLVRDEL